MKVTQEQPLERVLLAHAAMLADVPTREGVRLGVRALLSRLIPFDDALWTEISLSEASVRVQRGEALQDDVRLSAGLARDPLGHPAVASYVASPGDLQPRRLSQVTDVRRWVGSAMYRETFAPDGARHQLSLVTSLVGGSGEGWVLLRSGRDFSDDDVRVATFALPVLMLLDRLAGSRDMASPRDWHDGVPTDREREVLGLVARGMTAAQIGRARGISEATVRKHLQNVYRKIGEHDRMTAVAKARAWGLI